MTCGSVVTVHTQNAVNVRSATIKMLLKKRLRIITAPVRPKALTTSRGRSRSDHLHTLSWFHRACWEYCAENRIAKGFHSPYERTAIPRAMTRFSGLLLGEPERPIARYQFGAAPYLLGSALFVRTP